jgi:hypothetical protein
VTGIVAINGTAARPGDAITIVETAGMEDARIAGAADIGGGANINGTANLETANITKDLVVGRTAKLVAAQCDKLTTAQ